MSVPFTPRRIERLPVTPRLSSVLSAASSESAWAIALPITRARSVSHIANMWDSADELHDLLEHHRPGLLERAEIFRVWESSEDQCSRQARVIGPSATGFPDLLPDKTSLKREPPDSWSRDTVLRRKVSPIVQGSLVARGSAHDSKEASRILRLVTAMWALFLDVGSCGSLWEPYSSLRGELRDMHVSMIKESWCELPASTLTAALSVASRWKSWAMHRKLPWRSPLQAHVALWLRTLRPRGPTASQGAFRGLRWLETHVGLVFHTSSPQVKGQGVADTAHRERQATPMPVRVWAFLEHAATSDNAFVSAIALTWLIMIVGCLRFAHVQRSRIEEVTDIMIRGVASRGKGRSQGKRRPFPWSAPAVGMSGVRIGAGLQSYLRRAAAGQPTPQFILFDFLPARTPLSSVTSFSPSAMTYPRFLQFSKTLFEAGPLRLSGPEIVGITTYSARRVLPSIADAARLSVTERLAVGAWSDIAPDGSSMRVQAQRMAMPARYSEQKLVVAATVKSDLVSRAKAAIDTYSKSHPDVPNPMWDDVLACLPMRNEQCAHKDKTPSAIVVVPTRHEQCASSNSDLHASLVWVHAKARTRVLHKARLGPGGAASSTACTMRTVCGRTLADCTVGYGSPPSDRVWCHDCMPAPVV